VRDEANSVSSVRSATTLGSSYIVGAREEGRLTYDPRFVVANDRHRMLHGAKKLIVLWGGTSHVS